MVDKNGYRIKFKCKSFLLVKYFLSVTVSISLNLVILEVLKEILYETKTHRNDVSNYSVFRILESLELSKGGFNENNLICPPMLCHLFSFHFASVYSGITAFFLQLQQLIQVSL
uniref:Uncharacterized protein n=1 Tax=Glossina brevipalpis TaxID=37001 RepID=A0A1A9WYY5_9MUSC